MNNPGQDGENEENFEILDGIKRDRIVIGDLNPEILEMILKFIYAGEIELPEPTEEKKKLIKLIDAAEKYDLQELKAACFYKMFSEINDENAGEYAMVAHNYNADPACTFLIQDYCIK